MTRPSELIPGLLDLLCDQPRPWVYPFAGGSKPKHNPQRQKPRMTPGVDWAVAHESKRQQWMKKAMAPRAAPPPPRSSGNLYFRGARQLPHQSAPLLTTPELLGGGGHTAASATSSSSPPPAHRAMSHPVLGEAPALRQLLHRRLKDAYPHEKPQYLPLEHDGRRRPHLERVPDVVSGSGSVLNRAATRPEFVPNGAFNTGPTGRPGSASALGRSQSAGTIGQQQQRAMRPSSAGPRGRYGSFGMQGRSSQPGLAPWGEEEDDETAAAASSSRHDEMLANDELARALALAQTAADGQSMTRGEQQELVRLAQALLGGACSDAISSQRLVVSAQAHSPPQIKGTNSKYRLDVGSPPRPGSPPEELYVSKKWRDRQADKKWQGPGRRGVASKEHEVIRGVDRKDWSPARPGPRGDLLR